MIFTGMEVQRIQWNPMNEVRDFQVASMLDPKKNLTAFVMRSVGRNCVLLSQPKRNLPVQPAKVPVQARDHSQGGESTIQRLH
jgi:hypothetical protein